MLKQMQKIKNNYKNAGKNGGDANDVIALISFFLDLFALAEDIPPLLRGDLKLDLTPPMGGGKDVEETAELLQKALESRDKYIVVAPTGECVSRAILALFESRSIKDQKKLNDTYSHYKSLLDKLEIEV